LTTVEETDENGCVTSCDCVTEVIETSCEDSGDEEEFIRCLQDRVRTLEEDVSNVRSQLSSMESSCGATLDNISGALSSCS